MGIRRLTTFPSYKNCQKVDRLINAEGATVSGLLDISIKKAYRPGITAPFTLFSNKKGTASYNIKGRQFKIEDDALLVMNRGHEYDLMIDTPIETNIQNIHFNESFLRNAYTTFIHSSEYLLDNDITTELLEFTPRMLTKTPFIQKTIDSTQYLGHFEEDEDDQALLQIIDCLFWENENAKKNALKISSVKNAVKIELYERIRQAQDYIWSNYDKQLELDEICLTIGMSKFHFLRVFKSCLGISPYQYLIRIRHQKALTLLAKTKLPINQIAHDLGYEVVNSFNKSFNNQEGISPSKFRNSHI